MLPLPPGSLGCPLIGETPSYLKDNLKFLCEHHEKYGGIFKTKIYGCPTIVFGKSESISYLLGSGDANFVIKNNPIVTEFFRDALFMLSGERHLTERKLIQSVLQGEALDSYLFSMLSIVEKHIETWKIKRVIDIYQEILNITLDMCSEIILGITNETEKIVFQKLFEDFIKGTSAYLRLNLSFSKYQKGLKSLLKIRTLIKQNIVLKYSNPCNDVLSNLIFYCKKQGNFLTNEQIADHMLALLVAAKETTASLGTWLIYEIIRSKFLAKNIKEELSQIVNSPFSFSIKDIEKLPYFKSALLEAERLHSPNILSIRQVIQDCDFNGYQIPKGWQAAYSPAAGHFSPDHFSTPTQFIHERFLNLKNRQNSNSLKLLTFGHGRHSCVGKKFAEAQLLSICCIIVSKLSMKLLNTKDILPVYLITKIPKHGIWVEIES